jgi:hypothetical protein
MRLCRTLPCHVCKMFHTCTSMLRRYSTLLYSTLLYSTLLCSSLHLNCSQSPSPVPTQRPASRELSPFGSRCFPSPHTPSGATPSWVSITSARGCSKRGRNPSRRPLSYTRWTLSGADLGPCCPEFSRIYCLLYLSMSIVTPPSLLDSLFFFSIRTLLRPT